VLTTKLGRHLRLVLTIRPVIETICLDLQNKYPITLPKDGDRAYLQNMNIFWSQQGAMPKEATHATVKSVALTPFILSNGYFFPSIGQSLLEAGYYQWALFEPTSFAGEDCGGVNHEALLYDVDCSNPQPFICEYEPWNVHCNMSCLTRMEQLL